MKLGSRKTSLIITSIVFIIFLVYFVANLEKFKLLLHINFALLLLISLADMAVIAVNGLFTKAVLVPFKKSIGFLESYYVSLISAVGNYFAPVGAGFAFRAIYLKRKHNLPYSEYISILSGNYILVFLTSSILGLLALLMLGSNSSPQFLTLFTIFSLMLVGALLLCMVKIPFVKVESIHNRHLRSFGKILYRIVNGWNKITANKSLMARLYTLTLANAALSFINIWLIITALHISTTFPALLLFSVLGTLSLFINITPANLGVKEAIYLFSSSVLGFSTAQILSIALIDRGVLFIVLLILWLFSSKTKAKEKLGIGV
jgi:uncharacterized protein (TIRG00374 family)